MTQLRFEVGNEAQSERYRRARDFLDAHCASEPELVAAWSALEKHRDRFSPVQWSVLRSWFEHFQRELQAALPGMD